MTPEEIRESYRAAKEEHLANLRHSRDRLLKCHAVVKTEAAEAVERRDERLVGGLDFTAELLDHAVTRLNAQIDWLERAA